MSTEGKGEMIRDNNVIERYLKSLHEEEQSGDAHPPAWHRDQAERLQIKLKEPGLRYVKRVKMLAELRRHVALGDEGENPVAAFIAIAAAWGEENGVGYDDWREMGVPVAVLKAAEVRGAPKGQGKRGPDKNPEREECLLCPPGKTVIQTRSMGTHFRQSHPGIKLPNKPRGGQRHWNLVPNARPMP